MSKFLEGFLQGAQTQKLNQNHRDMNNMGSAIAGAVVEQVKQQRTIQELEREVQIFEISLDKLKTHNEAEAARSAYLMKLLDEAYGAESNPARQVAHPAQDFRIPSGDRKGEEITKADEVYLTRFIEVYKAKYAKKWIECVKDWVDFVHTRISY